MAVPFVATDVSEAEDENFRSLADSSLSYLDENNRVADPAVFRLSAAARWIANEFSGGKRQSHRLRRVGRLSPLRDISADIQRASTPHPRLKRGQEFNTQPEDEFAVDSQQASFWQQLNESEVEESDLWENSTDPFVSRSRPNSSESAQIEAEDIRRIELEEHPTLPYAAIQLPAKRRRLSIWHLACAILAIVALVVMGVDGMLLSFAFHHDNQALASGGGPPTLTLSSSVVSAGEQVSLHLNAFLPLTNVVLTHDVQENLLTTANTSTVFIDTTGQGSANFIVNSAWGPGFHLIVAEDISSRDTASSTLEISNEGPSRPPHLLLASPTLSMGKAVQGANTLRQLVLRNTGSGSISWSANTNQPWLLVAPQQGVFSAGQTIEVAAQRDEMQPGTYKAAINISSSVGAPEQIEVTMEISALPPASGPVISLTPPLLSFTTMDGVASYEMQEVTLSNPGQQELHWSLTSNSSVTTIIQNGVQLAEQQNAALAAFQIPSWLSAVPTSGVLSPGANTQISIIVLGQNLLPGSYMGSLRFSASPGSEAFDSPQTIAIALTVQAHCGLVSNLGNLTFTAVMGQSNPSTQALSLNATSGCASSQINWQAFSAAKWITINPNSGQIRGTNSSVTSIGVNTTSLSPGKYVGLVIFQAGQSTQTVTVSLNLQPRPAASEPIMGASPLSQNFSSIQGQANPTGQVVTITNNGSSPLKWHTNIAFLSADWISVLPKSGTVLPGQTGQMTIGVITNSLTPGNYTGQVTLEGTDARGTPASGSPQTITVSLVVQPPCTLTQPSASSLVFSSIAGGVDPLAQIVTLTGSGSCAWPLSWHTSVTPAAAWLTLTPDSGSLSTASQEGSISVGVKTSGLQPGNYSAQIMLSASDVTGLQAGNSPQTFSVMLTVLQPCTLRPLPEQLTFNAQQGQAAPDGQAFTLSETGSCDGGVSWTAVDSADSSSWLGLSLSSGVDAGSGSPVTVTANPGSLGPGTYTGQITVSASNDGIVLAGSPQVINVTLVITGYGVSGVVTACQDASPSCTDFQSLGSASVSLVDGNGDIIVTVLADSLGDFAFTNVPLGTYTINAVGTSGGASYTGTLTVTVGGSVSSVNVQTFAS
jgi:hypothetical protein